MTTFNFEILTKNTSEFPIKQLVLKIYRNETIVHLSNQKIKCNYEN